MNKLTKVGLTALASSLVISSASAVEFSLSGGVSASYGNVSNTSNANAFSFSDEVTFSASGDLDNGMSISYSLELDGNSMDDRKIAVSSDELGTVSITNSLTAGGIGRVGDVVPTAKEEVYDVTDATDYGIASQNISSSNQIGWVSPSFGGLVVSAGYTELDTEADSSWAY